MGKFTYEDDYFIKSIIFNIVTHNLQKEGENMYEL